MVNRHFSPPVGETCWFFATTLSKSKNIAEAVVVCKTYPLSIFVHATFIGRYLWNLGWRMILEFSFPKWMGKMTSNLTFDDFFPPVKLTIWHLLVRWHATKHHGSVRGPTPMPPPPRSSRPYQGIISGWWCFRIPLIGPYFLGFYVLSKGLGPLDSHETNNTIFWEISSREGLAWHSRLMIQWMWRMSQW